MADRSMPRAVSCPATAAKVMASDMHAKVPTGQQVQLMRRDDAAGRRESIRRPVLHAWRSGQREQCSARNFGGHAPLIPWGHSAKSYRTGAEASILLTAAAT